jgi:hypothetical protein
MDGIKSGTSMRKSGTSMSGTSMRGTSMRMALMRGTSMQDGVQDGVMPTCGLMLRMGLQDGVQDGAPPWIPKPSAAAQVAKCRKKPSVEGTRIISKESNRSDFWS